MKRIWFVLLFILSELVEWRESIRVLLVGNAVMRGHVMPLVEVGSALEAQGHSVRLATQEEGVGWAVDHACHRGIGPAKRCCHTNWQIHGCPDIISLGKLTQSHEQVRRAIGRALNEVWMLSNMWAISRDLYLHQAENTLQRLCAFLAPRFPEKNIQCPASLSSPSSSSSTLQTPYEEHQNENHQSTTKETGSQVEVAEDEENRRAESDSKEDEEVDAWRPDVILADIGAVGAIEAAEAFSIPIVLNSPTLLFSLEDTVPSATRHLPGWGSGFSRSMNLFQRCINVVYPRLMAVALTPEFTQLNQMRSSMNLKPYPSQHAIFQGKHILVNTALGFEYPRYTDAFTSYVGPLLDDKSKLFALDLLYSLQEEGSRRGPDSLAVVQWLDQQRRENRRVISVSFGSFGLMQPSLFETIIRGCKGYAVLWISSKENSGEVATGQVNVNAVLEFIRTKRALIDEDVMRAYYRYCFHGTGEMVNHKLCSNRYEVESDETEASSSPSSFVSVPFFVMERESNVSQLEVVSHPIIQVQVSHCGLAAAQEAILAGKILFCIPMFADQFDVAARVVDAAVGVSMDRELIRPRDMEEVLHFLHSSKADALLDSVQKLGRFLLEAGGVEKAIAIVESVGLYGPAVKLKSKEMDWPWYRSSLLDLYVLLFAIMTLAISLVYFCLSVCRACMNP